MSSVKRGKLVLRSPLEFDFILYDNNQNSSASTQGNSQHQQQNSTNIPFSSGGTPYTNQSTGQGHTFINSGLSSGLPGSSFQPTGSTNAYTPPSANTNTHANTSQSQNQTSGIPTAQIPQPTNPMDYSQTQSNPFGVSYQNSSSPPQQSVPYAHSRPISNNNNSTPFGNSNTANGTTRNTTNNTMGSSFPIPNMTPNDVNINNPGNNTNNSTGIRFNPNMLRNNNEDGNFQGTLTTPTSTHNNTLAPRTSTPISGNNQRNLSLTNSHTALTLGNTSVKTTVNTTSGRSSISSSSDTSNCNDTCCQNNTVSFGERIMNDSDVAQRIEECLQDLVGLLRRRGIPISNLVTATTTNTSQLPTNTTANTTNTRTFDGTPGGRGNFLI